MAVFDPAERSERDNYRTLIGSVVPRPIALMTTLSGSGVVNAAPFSYFSIVSADPPMVSISVQRRAGQPKDSSRNAMETGSFVVHVTDERNVGLVNRAAATLPPDISEVEAAGMTLVPSTKIDVPGIAEAGIRMECVLEHAYQLGGSEDAPACDLLIGRVVLFHIADELLVDGRISADKLKPVSRLGGSDYGTLGRMITLERPE